MVVLKVSLLLSLIALTFALPTVQDTPGRTISIPVFQTSHNGNRRDVSVLDTINIIQGQISRSKSKIKNALLAYNRNMGIAPQTITNGHMPLTASGEPLPTVKLHKLNKRAKEIVSNQLARIQGPDFWFTVVTVGSRPETIVVELDIATADSFFPSTDCDATCAGKTLYDPGFDTTAFNTTTPFDIFSELDPASASGFVFTDDVTLSGLTANDQGFGAANHLSPELQFPAFQASGRIGLALPFASEFGLTPFFSTLVGQNDVKPIFALRLSRNATSEFTLGGVNPAQFTGDPRNVTLFMQNGLYGIGIKQVFLDGALLFTPGPSLQGIFLGLLDSASPFILAPTVVVEFFYSNVEGAQDASAVLGPGFFTVPCDNVPTLSFKLGGKDKDLFEIDPSIFNQGVLEGNDCIGALVGDAGLDGFSDTWLIGTAFMQNFYTVIDQKNLHLSFSTLSQVEE